jgi:hypothetical protein
MRTFFGSTIAVSLLAASLLAAWSPASRLAADLNLPRQKARTTLQATFRRMYF